MIQYVSNGYETGDFVLFDAPDRAKVTAESSRSHAIGCAIALKYLNVPAGPVDDMYRRRRLVVDHAGGGRCELYAVAVVFAAADVIAAFREADIFFGHRKRALEGVDMSTQVDICLVPR